MNLFFQRAHSQKKDFDERQELVRNKGFKYAFYALLCYNILNIIRDIVQETGDGQSVTGFAAVCVSILVYTSYTIWNDGYFSFREKPGSAILTLSFMSAVNLAFGAIELFIGSSDLPVSPAIFSLMVGFTCLGTVIAALAKKLRSINTDEEEKG